MASVLLTLFYLLTPVLIIKLCDKYSWINKLGAVIIAYITGLLLGNLGVLPRIDNAATIQEIVSTVTIPLSIPLLLFSLNIRRWYTMAGKTLLSMLFALIAVLTVVISGFFIFSGNEIDELWKISGMLVGVYTGGTPNLASIKLALDVDETTYIITHTYDLLIGVFYLLFMLSVGQALFLKFLPSYKKGTTGLDEVNGFNGQNPYSGMFSKKIFAGLLKATGLSALIFAVSGGISLLVPENSQMAVVILFITTFGIAGALVPKINRIKKTFEAGMYLILIFSIVVASMADLSGFIAASPAILIYITMAVFGSLILQLLLSYFFKIDADTVLITSTAFICSPPFVPVVAAALKNREVIVSGLTVGIIGYAAGNYLGIIVAYLLRAF